MVSDALPFTIVTTPSDVAPSRNVTVPFSASGAGVTGATVAVSVTVWPVTEGLGVAVSVVDVAGGTKILPVIEKRLVSTTLTPCPPTLGPERRKKLVPKGLPMIPWSIAGWPMKPAGGADVASHCRNGPTLAWARARSKGHAGGVAPHPRSSVKLIVPVAAATKLRVP